MKPPVRSRALIRLLLPALLLAAPLRPAPAVQRAPALPSNVAALLSRARPLLDQGDAAGVRALSARPAALAWLREGRGRTRTEPEWGLHALALPARGRAAETWLAVFSKWQGVQSQADRIHRVERTAGGARFGAEIAETDTRGYRVRDHDLNVTFDLQAGTCAITDTVTVERTSPTAGALLLRLSADMTVERLTVDGAETDWRSVPGIVAVQAPAARKFAVTMAYRGAVRHRFSDYIRPNEVVLVSYWYPHIGRLPATSTITATVPAGWTAIAGGEQTRRTERGGQVTYTYRNDVPTCYFSLDAAQYTITERKVGARTVATYMIRQSDDEAQGALDAVQEALPLFERAFGPYPYTRFTMVQTNGPFGGALEAYSFATFDPGSMRWTAVHELSHTWWGGLVPNTYTRSMWNEGLATYSEGLVRRLASDRPGRAVVGLRQGERGSERPPAFPVPLARAHDTSNGEHGAAGYGKGAIVMGMLEDMLGTPVMLRCLRRLVREHTRGEAADWPDVRRAVERETGRDLEWFFAQWVERPGMPRLRLEDVRVEQAGGAWQARGRIVQYGPPYRLRLPVRVGTPAAGKVHHVEVTGASTAFALPADVRPTRVTVDPGGTLLLTGEGEGDPLAWRAP